MPELDISQLMPLLTDAIGEQVGKSVAEIRGEMTSHMDRLRAFEPQNNPKRERGQDFARIVRCIALGKGDPDNAQHWAKRLFPGDGGVIRALSTDNATAGGFLIQPEWSSDIIELLRSRAAIRKMQPTIMPMNEGTLTIPEVTGGATATYTGESTAVNATQQTTGQLVMTSRILTAKVPLTMQLLASPSANADRMVRDDLVAAFATREDQGFIRDDGSANKPKGIRYWASSTTASAGTTLANIRTDLSVAQGTVEDADSRMIRPGWLMHPRSRRHLQYNAVDSNGNLVFGPEMAGGTLNGWPFAVSTNVPANLGAGTNETELYFVDFADVVIGEKEALTIAMSGDASYTDSSGTLVSAFDRNEVVVRAIAEHDLVMRHAASAHVITGITWGA